MDLSTYTVENELVNSNELVRVTSKAENTQENSVSTRKHQGEQQDTQYECTVCQEMFVNENDLTKHYRDHMEKNLYMCVSDDEEVESIEKHILSEEEVSFLENIHSKILEHLNFFECDVCHKVFSFKHSLIRHYAVHAEINLKGSFSEEKQYTCCVCNKSFILNDQLRRHYRCHVKPHECDVCHKRFPFRSNLLTHYRTHLDNASLVCPVCFKTYDNRKDLKFHAITHKEFEPLITIVDRKSNSDFSETNEKCLPDINQIEIDSFADKPFRCDRCDKSFDNKSNLSIHYGIHTRVKRHECIVCFKSFTKTSHLQNHLRIHTGEKPYSCNVCERAFSEKGNLRKHQQRHTKVTTSKKA